MRHLAVLAVVACGSSQPAKPVKPAPTCAAAADHTLTLLESEDDHARKIRDIFQLRCERDGWAADVRTCIVATKSLADPQGCKAKLTPAQRDVLDRQIAEADRAARAKQVPAACVAYQEMIEKLMSCDKLPPQSRDALKQAFEATTEAWKNAGDMPEEARREMAENCGRAAEAIAEAAGAACGW